VVEQWTEFSVPFGVIQMKNWVNSGKPLTMAIPSQALMGIIFREGVETSG